jgi:gluconolactonase
MIKSRAKEHRLHPFDPKATSNVNTFLRDAGVSDLVDGPIEVIADGFVFTEGPVWVGDRLLFQDLRSSVTYAWMPGHGSQPLRSQTRGANGQTLAPDGRIAFCEQDGRRVSSMNAEGGEIRILCESFDGKRLNSPNDLVFGPSENLFFTDPAYGVPRPEDKELPFQGVFHLDYEKGSLRLLTSRDFEKPNGLAFSPDGCSLYVNDTGKYHVRRLGLRRIDGQGESSFEVADDCILATFNPEVPGGPDGLKVDVEGRLYVAVAQGIWVLEPQGKLIGIIATSKRPSNLAWGDGDRRTLYITAVDQVLRVRMRIAGI